MARTKSKKDNRQNGVKVKTAAPAKKSAPPQDDSASEMSDLEQYDAPAGQDDMDMSEDDKDAAEEELERAVFGDSMGFRAGLASFGAGLDDEDSADEGAAASGDEQAYDNLADADLFFTDVGASTELQPVPATEEEEEEEGAAWQDSDDERMVVSLASVPRLRKLRKTEAEDVISGKDYVRRLRKHYEMLNPVPDWAVEAAQKGPRKKRRLSYDDLDAESEDDMDMDDDEEGDNDDISAEPLSKLLQGGGLVRRTETKKRKLRPEVLDIQRTKDIGSTQPSAITSLQYHPELPLLLSSGPSSTLYLHHIVASPPAPEANPLLTSLHIRKTPLTTTAFHPNDPRIFLSARRRYFHVWNLETGKVEKIARVYGHQHEQRSMERFKLSPDGRSMALIGSARKGGGVINILDAYTLQWASQVRIESNNGIADFAWWRDSRGMSIAGKNGEVTEWNIDEQRAVARWQDEGAVGTTTITLGGDNGNAGSPIGKDRWVAVGSSSGVVNIYDRRAWLVASSGNPSASPIPNAPKPTRALDNLTTPISHLTFSPDGQMLVMASRWKKDALRIVHLPTCTVFKNWPTSNTPLGRITGVAFAPGSDGLAVANEQGKIRCWEVRA
ncbi:WD40 repeat-like protein [Aureobasidium pullulans]|uniref:WD40 repeat-like protein n=1 Tax=Aureobasidium pullulans TaxID=5580 RepID=A0A4V4KK38_AURPU|nr:WD40 repeat-like protein [Aureobasidium pullulans]